ncbi:MAG: hypothetical protein PQJ60_14375 [Spirochaetales bacterium]|nr:hypothetical protein [Spirochaetales bacterium]
MKQVWLLLALFLPLSLSAETSLLMDRVEDMTGLTETHFLIQGFRSVDRALFLPERFAALAYEPVDIPLREGVAALSPSTLIDLFLEAGLEEGHRVLVVGEEASYCATALSRSGMEVYLIDPGAEASSSYRLNKNSENLNGWISMAPFDFILYLKPEEEISQQLIKQLSLRGTLICPLLSKDLLQCWFKVVNNPGGLSLSMMGSASVFPLF